MTRLSPARGERHPATRGTPGGVNAEGHEGVEVCLQKLEVAGDVTAGGKENRGHANLPKPHRRRQNRDKAKPPLTNNVSPREEYDFRDHLVLMRLGDKIARMRKRAEKKTLTHSLTPSPPSPQQNP